MVCSISNYPLLMVMWLCSRVYIFCLIISISCICPVTARYTPSQLSAVKEVYHPRYRLKKTISTQGYQARSQFINTMIITFAIEVLADTTNKRQYGLRIGLLTLLLIFATSILLIVKLHSYLVQQLIQTIVWGRAHSSVGVVHCLRPGD